MYVNTTQSPRFRILVITNETAEGDELHDAVLAVAGRHYPVDVRVVAPALNTRLRHWLSDDDAARLDAVERVDGLRRAADRAGLSAEGTIGDPDPLQAIEDALGTFLADGLIIATHPEGSSNWLARNLVQRAELRFDLPISHVVVDSAGSAARADARGWSPCPHSVSASCVGHAFSSPQADCPGEHGSPGRGTAADDARGSARLPRDGEADGSDLQPRLRVLLLPLQGDALPEQQVPDGRGSPGDLHSPAARGPRPAPPR